MGKGQMNYEIRYWDFHTESLGICNECQVDTCILDGGDFCPDGYDPNESKSKMTMQERNQLYADRAKERILLTIREEIEPLLPASIKEINQKTGIRKATVYSWTQKGYLNVAERKPGGRMIVTSGNYEIAS